MSADQLDLKMRTTPGAEVSPTTSHGWRLAIPAGGNRAYRWAQLDDYLHLARSAFRWSEKVSLSLRARVSEPNLPGTWGMGFWNDPFNASLGLRGTARRLPALPNAAWFFHASPPNYLAFHDSHPAQGCLAATFSSPTRSPVLLALAVPGLPFLAIRQTARFGRRCAQKWVQDDAARLDVDETAWHAYRLELEPGRARFWLDGEPVFETDVAPVGRLGLVIWIDNQFAAFPPDGRIRFGVLAAERPTWLEIEDLHVGNA